MQTIPDPYNNRIYQATLNRFDKRIYVDGIMFNTENVSKLLLEIEIELVPGGININYNPDTFSFDDDEQKAILTRELNAIFLKNGFILDAVMYNSSVYRCCSSVSGKKKEFVFNPNENIINENEAEEINRLIAKIFARCLI